NQLLRVRRVTPGICAMRAEYESGSDWVMEMALRVTMRSAAEASLLAYQAVRMVRRKRKATAVITTPRTVSTARVLLRRNALRTARVASVTTAVPCRAACAPGPPPRRAGRA